jgi:hypothetical protein
MSPATCRCLLLAIEGLEAISRRRPVMGSTGVYREVQLETLDTVAEQACVTLESIRQEWHNLTTK